MTYDLPDNLIGEVTLIGTGGGYGESIVVHIGNGKWIIIDSCTNPKTKKSLPLEYLTKIGVNLSIDIKMILCTHWHDDHLKGLSQLLIECKSAEFCMAEVTDRKKFLQMVSLDALKFNEEPISDSSTYEFNKCLEIAKINGNRIVFAKSNCVLDKTKLIDTLFSETFALSPSDHTIECFMNEISTLITEFGSQNKKIPINKPNAKSVAIYLKLGKHAVLLGSDLELSKDDKEGWLNILNHNKVIDKPASLLKIAHHGSLNGYSERIFSELMDEKPVTKLTPWNKKDKLPQAEMIAKYRNHSSAIYITSPIKLTNKAKKRERDIEKLIAKFNINLMQVPFELGIVRNRIDLNDSIAKWKTDLFDSAFKI